MPVVEFSDDVSVRGVAPEDGVLTRWAAERPFVWLDDEITAADRA